MCAVTQHAVNLDHARALEVGLAIIRDLPNRILQSIHRSIGALELDIEEIPLSLVLDAENFAINASSAFAIRRLLLNYVKLTTSRKLAIQNGHPELRCAGFSLRQVLCFVVQEPLEIIADKNMVVVGNGIDIK